MKYLYYTFYLFYTKIIPLHNPPIINITAVMSALAMVLVLSIAGASNIDIDILPPYSAIIPGGLAVILWKLLYEYYKPREAELLNKMKNKPLRIKIIIVLLSTAFIILIVKLWLFNGMNDVYQFIKLKFFR